MPTAAYNNRRDALETYFDRTAAEAWKRLTSDAPVSKIRETVRAGRDRMRAALLARLPDDLSGRRLLDAGCGSGALSVAAAERGAEVIAIDVAQQLVDVARERAVETAPDAAARIDFRVGDMLDPALGAFDHVVAMDSLIHYRADDVARAMATLAERASRSMLITFAPRTPALTVMHATGKLFPRSDRSPAIEPVSFRRLARLAGEEPALAAWDLRPGERVSSGFYISDFVEIARREAGETRP